MNSWQDYFVDHVKTWEGLELQAYQDVAGVWTIGYGHTGPDVQPGMKITEDRAEELLWQDTEWAERVVDNTITVPMSPNQKAVFVSLAYNIGAGGFRNSTAAKRFNAGDLAGAAEAITWWNKARVNGKLQIVRGLVNRRNAERELFLREAPQFKSVPQENEPKENPSTKVDRDGEPVSGGAVVVGGEHKPLTQSSTIRTATVAGGSMLGSFGMLVDSVKDMHPVTAVLIVVAICAVGYLIFNRYVEWKKGEH